jgi:hypothetical protein
LSASQLFVGDNSFMMTLSQIVPCLESLDDGQKNMIIIQRTKRGIISHTSLNLSNIVEQI